MAENAAYQLKILLYGSKPPIWRRVMVNPDIKLSALHHVIQAVFGWGGHHLHHFVKEYDYATMEFPRFYGIPNYGVPEGDRFSFGCDVELIDSSKVVLSSLLKKEKDIIIYEYDFGDDWVHDVMLEKIVDNVSKDQELPLCLTGRKACPPDDCGGLRGYYELLDVIKDKEHKEHKNAKAWLRELGFKNFNPDYFNVDEINENMRTYLKEVA